MEVPLTMAEMMQGPTTAKPVDLARVPVARAVETDGLPMAKPMDLARVWLEKAKRGSVQWVDACPEAQLRAYRWWKRGKLPALLLRYLLLFLSLGEHPTWCVPEAILCAPDQPDMPHAVGMFTPRKAMYLMEIAILLCLVLRFILRWFTPKARQPLGRWNRFGIFLVAVSLLDCCVMLVHDGGIWITGFRVARFSRPLVFLAFHKPLRQVAERVFRSVPFFLDSLVSLVICVTVFAWVGLLVFAKSGEGWERFSNWQEAFTSLWVLFTTANFPDVMLPSLEYHKEGFVYFFFYIVISFYCINNVILASVYDAYKKQLTSSVHYYYENRSTATYHAFMLLAGGSHQVSHDRWCEFFKIGYSSLSSRELQADLEDCPCTTAGEDCTGNSPAALSIAAADNLSQGLNFEHFQSIVGDMLDGRIYIHSSQFPRLARTDSSRLIRRCVVHGFQIGGSTVAWDTLVDLLIFAELVLLLVQTVIFVSPREGGPFAPDIFMPDRAWSYALFGFSCLYALDITAKIAAFGFERFWHRNALRYRFDFLTVYPLMLLELTILIGGVRWEPALRWLALLRLVRGLKLLRHATRLERLGRLLACLLPIYRNVGMSVIIVYILYAELGCSLFGGLIYKSNPVLEGSDYKNQGYWSLNFNDVPSGIMTLFSVMMTNNWYIITDGFLRVSGTKWSVAFFISFWIVTNLVFLNILLTLIVECFGSDHVQDTANSRPSSSELQVSLSPQGRYQERSREEIVARLLLSLEGESGDAERPLAHAVSAP